MPKKMISKISRFSRPFHISFKVIKTLKSVLIFQGYQGWGRINP
jgi:hypothetical protein